MNKERLIAAMSRLGYPLMVPEEQELTKGQVLEILDDLANTSDVRLLEGFPVVLANCAQRSPKLDLADLLSRYGERSKRRQNLEKILLVSWSLFNQEGLSKPRNLDRLAERLNEKYSDLLASESIALRKGVVLSKERLRNALRRYGIGLAGSQSVREDAKTKQRRSFILNLHMRTIFSPKQSELVFKKLRGEALSKTEQEYYSRVVKKKLQALTNPEVRRIASSLARE